MKAYYKNAKNLVCKSVFYKYTKFINFYKKHVSIVYP